MKDVEFAKINPSVSQGQEVTDNLNGNDLYRESFLTVNQGLIF